MKMETLPALMAAAVLMSFTAMAQYSRGDRYDGGRYERRDGGFNVIRAVEEDLQRAASRGYAGGHERNRLDHALRRLDEFEREPSRGGLDRHALDHASERGADGVRR